MTKILIDEAVVRQAQQVPLHELLAKVPADARLVIEDKDGCSTSFIPVGRLCQEAATVIRQALEQPAPAPAQEPVAWSVTWDGVHCGNFYFREQDAREHKARLDAKRPGQKREVVPLYTTPPAPAQPLTERQRWDMYQSGEDMPTTMASVYMRGVQDAEAAHGITKGGE